MNYDTSSVVDDFHFPEEPIYV